MAIRPIRDQVLVQRDPPPTASGLVLLPETVQAWRSNYGTALAVGPKARTVKAGNRLFLPDLGGVEFRHEGVLLALFPEDDIIGVLPDAGTES